MNSETDIAEVKNEILSCIRQEAAKTRRTITIGFFFVCAFLLLLAAPVLGVPAPALIVTSIIILAICFVAATIGLASARTIAYLRERHYIRLREKRS